MPVKKIERPEVVHQLKDCKGAEVTTKCGLAGRKDKVRTTAWHSETTCEVCNP